MSGELPIPPELSGEDRRRYSRQIRLAEIGERGQRALCTSVVALRSEGFGRTVEERYVRAAGMQLDERSATDPIGPLHALLASGDLNALGLRHASSREVASGALHALLAVRAALGITG